MSNPAIEVRNLSICFSTKNGDVGAVRDVSFKIDAGETFGLAGESGSGKSSIAYAIMRYLPSNGRIAAGRILFKGEDLLYKSAQELRTLWGNEIAMVYQDPRTSLNPCIRVGHQIAEVLQIHRGLNDHRAWLEALNIVEMVNIPDPQFNAVKYPHQLSGGMQQRIVIAMALACDPALLIMDEPTTGLDVTTQAKIIDLVEDLQEKVRASILYITHDLSVIAQVSDRVGIIYAGEMIESGPVSDIFHQPVHPYTIGLLEAIPDVDLQKPFKPIEGQLPDRTRDIPACVFAPRCEFKKQKCEQEKPGSHLLPNGHFAKCFRWEETSSSLSNPHAAAERSHRQQTVQTLLEVDQVKKYYGRSSLTAKLIGRQPALVKAVDDVSFEVWTDEIFALVGESGCGKTTLARCLIGLLDLTKGRINYFLGQDAPGSDKKLGQSVQMIFQHPDSSMNPLKTIGAILNRPLKLYGLPKAKRKQRIQQLLESVRLNEDYIPRYPKELSGGEKQRVAIARAFAADPDFVLLDEPVSALDVSIQAAIINLLLDLRDKIRISFLFISHDLSLVRHVADRVGVMYLGKLCEIGDIESIFTPPYHPYTKALLSAIPSPDPDKPKRLIRLEGTIPSAKNPPSGCRFHTRCPGKIGPICEQTEPDLLAVSENHSIACHIPLEILANEEKII
ncbi:MAG: ABC transporter ATP-binding protein [bacterium]|nr:ABC transporter ATP-binding protein [bacterium]